MMMATLMSNLRMFNPRLDSVLHRRTCNGVKKKKYIVDVGLIALRMHTLASVCHGKSSVMKGVNVRFMRRAGDKTAQLIVLRGASFVKIAPQSWKRGKESSGRKAIV